MSNNGRIVQLLNPTNNQDAATKSYVDTSIPIGGIVMWSGTTGTSLPSNWKLCDGSTYNGITTPDLRGRFVLSSTTPISANGNIALGAGLSTRNVNARGSVETVALALGEMPSHTHAVSASSDDQGGHSHTATVTDPGHKHEQSSNSGPINTGGPWTGSSANGWGNYLTTASQTTGISVSIDTRGSHSHTITVSESSRGSGTAHENMPPFYVLAFIMRVS